MKNPTRLMMVLLLSGTLTLCAGTGCASHTTRTTETVTTQDAGPATGDGAASEPSASSKTVTTTTRSDGRSPGIIGSTFGLVWAVIAFPFRVIGDLF